MMCLCVAVLILLVTGATANAHSRRVPFSPLLWRAYDYYGTGNRITSPVSLNNGNLIAFGTWEGHVRLVYSCNGTQVPGGGLAVINDTWASCILLPYCGGVTQLLAMPERPDHLFWSGVNQFGLVRLANNFVSAVPPSDFPFWAALRDTPLPRLEVVWTVKLPSFLPSIHVGPFPFPASGVVVAVVVNTSDARATDGSRRTLVAYRSDTGARAWIYAPIGTHNSSIGNLSNSGGSGSDDSSAPWNHLRTETITGSVTSTMSATGEPSRKNSTTTAPPNPWANDSSIGSNSHTDITSFFDCHLFVPDFAGGLAIVADAATGFVMAFHAVNGSIKWTEFVYQATQTAPDRATLVDVVFVGSANSTTTKGRVMGAGGFTVATSNMTLFTSNLVESMRLTSTVDGSEIMRSDLGNDNTPITAACLAINSSAVHHTGNWTFSALLYVLVAARQRLLIINVSTGSRMSTNTIAEFPVLSDLPASFWPCRPVGALDILDTNAPSRPLPALIALAVRDGYQPSNVAPNVIEVRDGEAPYAVRYRVKMTTLPNNPYGTAAAGGLAVPVVAVGPSAMCGSGITSLVFSSQNGLIAAAVVGNVLQVAPSTCTALSYETATLVASFTSENPIPSTGAIPASGVSVKFAAPWKVMPVANASSTVVVVDSEVTSATIAVGGARAAVFDAVTSALLWETDPPMTLGTGSFASMILPLPNASGSNCLLVGERAGAAGSPSRTLRCYSLAFSNAEGTSSGLMVSDAVGSESSSDSDGSDSGSPPPPAPPIGYAPRAPLAWAFRCNRTIRSAPVYFAADGMLYVGDDGNSVHAINASTGAIVWQVALAAGLASRTGGKSLDQGDIMNRLVVDAFRVFVGSTDGFVYSLDRTTGVLNWAVMLLLPSDDSRSRRTPSGTPSPSGTSDTGIWGDMVLFERYLFLCDDLLAGYLFVLDSETGSYVVRRGGTDAGGGTVFCQSPIVIRPAANWTAGPNGAQLWVHAYQNPSISTVTSNNSKVATTAVATYGMLRFDMATSQIFYVPLLNTTLPVAKPRTPSLIASAQHAFSPFSVTPHGVALVQTQPYRRVYSLFVGGFSAEGEPATVLWEGDSSSPSVPLSMNFWAGNRYALTSVPGTRFSDDQSDEIVAALDATGVFLADTDTGDVVYRFVFNDRCPPKALFAMSPPNSSEDSRGAPVGGDGAGGGGDIYIGVCDEVWVYRGLAVNPPRPFPTPAASGWHLPNASLPPRINPMAPPIQPVFAGGTEVPIASSGSPATTDESLTSKPVFMIGMVFAVLGIAMLAAIGFAMVSRRRSATRRRAADAQSEAALTEHCDPPHADASMSPKPRRVGEAAYEPPSVS